MPNEAPFATQFAEWIGADDAPTAATEAIALEEVTPAPATGPGPALGHMSGEAGDMSNEDPFTAQFAEWIGADDAPTATTEAIALEEVTPAPATGSGPTLGHMSGEAGDMPNEDPFTAQFAEWIGADDAPTAATETVATEMAVEEMPPAMAPTALVAPLQTPNDMPSPGPRQAGPSPTPAEKTSEAIALDITNPEPQMPTAEMKAPSPLPALQPVVPEFTVPSGGDTTHLPDVGGPALGRLETPAQSAPQPTAPPLDTAVAGWTDRMADDIAGARLVDGQKLEFSLTPERLGALQIRLTVENGAAQVQVLTENPEAARLLSEAQPRLADALARVGLELTQHSTDLMGAEQERASPEGQDDSGDTPQKAAALDTPETWEPAHSEALPSFSRIERIA
ncbi:MAG: flagellar hook-length control protein FliK [Rhodobacteraceae bacterium]|nr:flagellar hook-length control protein FliK [Paracoccaceae bacterium]